MAEVQTLVELQALLSRAEDLLKFWKELIMGNKLSASLLMQATMSKLEGLDEYWASTGVVSVKKNNDTESKDGESEEGKESDDEDKGEDGEECEDGEESEDGKESKAKN